MREWLDGVRRRIALALWPAIDTANGKRHLEHVARECGLSHTLAKRLASTFFRTLHDGH